MADGSRAVGEFCWINIMTPEPAGARAFFEAVLGWTFFVMPEVGHGIRVGGRDFGGLFDLNGPGTPPDLAPTMGVMVKVASADATAARVESLGGTLCLPPFDIGDKGRMAVCTAPDGARFDLWESRGSAGTAVDRSLPGAPSWFEALTTDVARASAFYAELFGWTPEVMPMPGFDYTSFKLGDLYTGGMMAITPEMPGLTPVWATYFTVTDPDETAKVAAERGGVVHVAPRDIPTIGRFCGITSPQGVPFYAIRYLPR